MLFFVSSCASLRSPHVGEADRVLDCSLKDIKDDLYVLNYCGALTYNVKELNVIMCMKKNCKHGRIENIAYFKYRKDSCQNQ